MNYTTKRTLSNLFLDMSNPLNRIIRRGIIIGGLTAISVFLTGLLAITPEYTPVIVGLLALVDKALREHKN